MKKLKKLVLLLSACIAMLSVSAFGTSAVGANAMFLNGVKLVKSSANHVISFEFSENLGAEAATSDTIKDAAKDYFVINDTKINDLQGVAYSYKKLSGDKVNTLQITVPISNNVIKLDGSDSVMVISGYKAQANAVSTVDYLYQIDSQGIAVRNYRRSNDLYEDVKFLSVSAPLKKAGVKENMKLSLYFDKQLTSRKTINMEFFTAEQFVALALAEYPYSATEVKTLFDYGIVGTENPNSMLYKIQIGATKFNSLKIFGTETAMSNHGVVNGLELYDVKTLMLSTGGSEASDMLLSVQIHLEKNVLEFALKGDNKVQDQFNLAPDSAAAGDMVIRIKAGMLFPTGVMTKEDITFVWESAKGMWKRDGSITSAIIDETLANQGGYTDDEIAALKAAK